MSQQLTSAHQPKRLECHCWVCGDQALGMNFNALTCMSCKAFFRRNALQNKVLKCALGTNACSINRISRKFCTKCRLAKCFTVGMRKEWIVTALDKATYCKRRLLLERIPLELRAEVEIIPQSVEQMNTETDSESVNGFVNETFELLSQGEIEQLQRINTDLDRYLGEVGGNYAELLDDDMDDNEPEPEILEFAPDYITHLLLTPDLDAFYPNIPMAPELDLFPPGELLYEEAHLIRELSTACTVLQNPYIRLRNLSYYQDPPTGGVSQYMFLRLIRMCKQLSAFQELGPGAQRRLLRSNVLNMLATRSVLIYNPERELINIMDDKDKVTVVVPLERLRSRLQNAHQADFASDLLQAEGPRVPFIKDFHDDWKRDDTIMDLLTAIGLFTCCGGSEQDDPMSMKSITEKLNCYTRLLARYLSFKYPQPQEAEANFQELHKRLSDTRRLSQALRLFYQIGYQLAVKKNPLMAELLDM